MRTVNIHEGKTQLSKLVEEAANGDYFIIAKAGKPMVKIVAVDGPTVVRRLGFLEGKYPLPEEPDEADKASDREIEKLFFYGEP